MSEIQVTLTQDELEIAAIVAVKRQCQNLFSGRKDGHGFNPENGWSVHVEGAAGEMAFAKWRDRYWNGNLGDLRADDVGNVQIRTATKHHYSLLIHVDDPDDRPFVLVTGMAPQFAIRGWIWGRDGKQALFWKDPVGGRPAFFVPQTSLRPMVKQGIAA